MDDSVRSYKIRFDDGTSESNVLGEYIQFISRPDENDRINNVSVIENNGVDDEVISLLDPLGENNVVKQGFANTVNVGILIQYMFI